ncbi:TlpA disulfide reductase family protein [Marilutibacter alkalisoli]|nr:TlpA disulfide reductase family protein [Lysobacter alkalisoli]
MSRIILCASLLTAALVVTAAQPPSPRLGIGDVPPPLSPMAWIKGNQVTEFQSDHVYVVSFFATWCGASRQAMPLMSQLARQHAGDLTVIGVNVRESERGDPSVESISRFVAERPESFDHIVAMDDPMTAPLFQSWMRSADMYGTPTAFVIGRDGRIVWIGIPIDDRAVYTFEQAVADAVSGSVNLDASRAVHVETAREISEYLEAREVLADVDAARMRGDHAATLTAIDAVVAERPEYRHRTRDTRLSALLHIDESKALAFAEQELEFVSAGELAEHRGRIAGSIGRTVAGHPDLSPAAQAWALFYLRQGIEAEPEGSGGVLNWLSLAELEHARGHIDQAIAAQERAVRLARTAREVTAESLKELERTLSEYRAQRMDGATSP